MTPKDVRKSDVLYLISLSLSDGKAKKPKYYSGMTVRLASENKQFKKGYKAQFQNEVFTIVKAMPTKPTPTYKIRGADGDLIGGIIYEYELVPYRPS